MSSLAFLVTELQSLSSETRRKHPEVREAAEKSLAILRASPEQATASLAADGGQSEELLRPVFMGCATKNAKVVGISLGSLQRLISLKAVPPSAIPLIVTTMSDCVSQGVDIQLRILQTLLSLITNFPQMHGSLLGDALMLCFKLHESRIMVVSSTAAATLRQLVMFVVDKVVDEDKHLDSAPQIQLTPISLPDGSERSLAPSAHDAFAVFQDLCLLANSEKPIFFNLEALPKTFALELIESVVTNYHNLFRNHPELLLLIQHHLSPLLLRALSDRPNFPLSLRSTRVVFLLLKQFLSELDTDAEVFFMLLIRIIGESESGSNPNASESSLVRPLWMRVLAMEIMRGLCSDSELLRRVWDRYDAHEDGSKVFTSLVGALRKLVTERPALLGVGQQMLGVGVIQNAPESASTPSSYGLDLGGVAGRVASAATTTVSGVVGMIASGPAISTQGSSMKLQCIDQLDKADSPAIPESYVYLLGIQCLASISEGFATFAAPLYTSIVVQKPRVAGDAVIRAPPALDVSTLPTDAPHTKHLRIVHSMVESAWPALLAALSFLISTNLSDELFVDVLASTQSLTNVAGMLGLTTPRDAFLASLAKSALPARVVSSVDQFVEPPTPRTATSFSENLGLTGPSQPPGLSERNMACLKVLISSAVFLAGSLGTSWFDVLETLQNADYVLTLKGTRPLGTGNASAAQLQRKPSVGGAPPPPKHPLLSDLDPENLEISIQRLFETSKNMEDPAFQFFVGALCRLSAAMVGMQSMDTSPMMPISYSVSSEDVPAGALSPNAARQRRRVSGIVLPKTLRSGDFAISKLGGVAQSNIHRLVYRAPDIAWEPIISHLLSVVCDPSAPQPIRVQAARVLDEVLLVVPRNLSNIGESKADVQQRVLDALSAQVILDRSGPELNSGSVELRRMGLETLHQILQTSGHTLVVGWDTIFDMLISVCKPALPVDELPSTGSSSLSLTTGARRPPPLTMITDRGYTSLVKIAFQSLTLVCDALSSFSPENMRHCIATIGHFGRQADTNIALTAAESLLWSVSDSIQAKRKEAETESEYNNLWMYLLLELLGLCTDARSEVRSGAIQTLFRTLQLYGATLSLDTWDECLWKVVFPLLDSITSAMHRQEERDEEEESHAPDHSWDDSKILALQSTGSIFNDFQVSKIVHLDSFDRAWNTFISHVQAAVLNDNRRVSPPALQCLSKAIESTSAIDISTFELQIMHVYEKSWEACESIGNVVLGDALSTPKLRSGETRLEDPFSQESLVAFVDIINSIRTASKKHQIPEWSLPKSTRLMAILKGTITYPNSLDYRPDNDSLTPLQKTVMDAVKGVDLSSPGAASLVLRDLAEYGTLAFMAAFDAPEAPPATESAARSSKPPRKRVTYVALAKQVMPLLVELYLRHQRELGIYADGTLEAVVAAYSIPLKMKYDCPPASKFGKDPPLWKTATTCFLQIIREATTHIEQFGNQLSADTQESIWRQIIDVYRGGILADCSAAEAFPLEVQQEEENFDLALVSSLEIDVIARLGASQVPDSLIRHLAKTLQEGSRLHDFEMPPLSGSQVPEEKGASESRDFSVGTTHPGLVVPRERFSYWCFDLFFLVCSDTAKDQESSRRRVAALALPALLGRCQSTLVSYVADQSLRGNLPFGRVREEEVLYVLRKILSLRLWPGSLWAALSDAPSQHCTAQPAIETSLPPAELVADAVRRSTKAHLFHLYAVLCEIASLAGKVPVAWLPNGIENGVEEYDARTLARKCLQEIGREMGIMA